MCTTASDLGPNYHKTKIPKSWNLHRHQQHPSALWLTSSLAHQLSCSTATVLVIVTLIFTWCQSKGEAWGTKGGDLNPKILIIYRTSPATPYHQITSSPAYQLSGSPPRLLAIVTLIFSSCWSKSEALRRFKSQNCHQQLRINSPTRSLAYQFSIIPALWFTTYSTNYSYSYILIHAEAKVGLWGIQGGDLQVLH